MTTEPILAYLDVDDEITSAAERIRGAGGGAIALVLPAGSRLGTSRLNFRLLAREAERHGTRLAIVSPEPPTRAVAEAAGIAAFATVPELERAPGVPESSPPPDSLAPGGSSRDAAAEGAGGGRSGLRGSTGIGRALRTTSVDPVIAPPRRRRVGLLATLTVLLLAAVLAAGGYATIALLPSATVTLVVRPSALDPVAVDVTADPDATSVDEAAGVIPAERRTFPLAVSGTFPATGVHVTETSATGLVRWENCDPTRAYTIPAGTRVGTKARVAFTTDEAVFLPVATITGRTRVLTCQRRDVGITARAAGPDGNVAAEAISVIPGIYNAVVIRAWNPAPTTGGTRTETPVVTTADVDGAVRTLAARLDEALAAEAERLAGEGGAFVVFPPTATRSEASAEPARASLVDAESATFEFALAATGAVLAVDPGPIRTIAEARLAAAVPGALELLPESVAVEVGEGRVVKGVIRFTASATGRAVRRIEPEDVRAAVAGRPLGEARAALDELGGEGTIVVWPDFVATVPPAGSDRLVVDVRYEAGP